MGAQTIATVTVKFADKSEKVYSVLDGQTIKIGRDKANDVVLEDPAASRLHATITASSNGVVVADRSSLNGTFVNGRQLEGLKDLMTGDIIDIGSCKFFVEIKSQVAIESLSGSTASRAMTAQMRPIAVTVLVATVKDYFRMIETLPTNAVVERLVAWCEDVKGIVVKNQGKIDKIIESSIVAVWSGQEKEQQAVQSIYSVQQIFTSTNRMIADGRWPHQHEFPWEVQVSVSSGVGLQGALGANSKQSEGGFTIVGDPINEAFSLQKYSDKFTSTNVISPETARLASSLFTFEKLGQVALTEDTANETIYSLQLPG
jgi:pSer/pThr/pTyr-binding forkhead associated (FHA) protein